MTVTRGLGEIPQDGKCPKCRGPLELRENQFCARGRWFPGLVCVPCNALWEESTDFVQWAKESAGGVR